MAGSALAALLVIGGSAWLFGWLYTVVFPDHSTSATDLYPLAVVMAAIVGAIVGIGLVVGAAFWIVLRRRQRLAAS